MELDNLLDKLRMDHLGAQIEAVCEQAARLIVITLSPTFGCIT